MVDTHIAVETVVGPQNTSWVQFLAVLSQYDHQKTSVVDLMVDPMVEEVIFMVDHVVEWSPS